MLLTNAPKLAERSQQPIKGSWYFSSRFWYLSSVRLRVSINYRIVQLNVIVSGARQVVPLDGLPVALGSCLIYMLPWGLSPVCLIHRYQLGLSTGITLQ